MNELTDRVQKLEAELAQLKNSGAYLVGTALLAIAKDPRRSLVAVRNLVRLWRLRHESDNRQFSTELGEPMMERIRRPSVFNFGPRVAVIGSDLLMDQLGKDCYVLPLMPHDKDVADVLLPFKPQVLLIEANAGKSSLVWQHLGSPLAPDRSAQLARIVSSANRHQIPVLVLVNAPRKNWEHAFGDLKIDQYLESETITAAQIKQVISNG